jgi:hypothetical protein
MGSINRDRLPKTGMLRLGRPNHVWIARCFNCGRKSLLPAQEMLQRFGEQEPLARATLKLKCSGCRKLGAVAYLGELPEPAEPYG